MRLFINEDVQSFETAAPGGVVVGLGRLKGYYVESTITVETPAAGTFTAATTDICTKAAHDYLLGLKVRLTTSNTLPAGLALATDYFVIPIDANTFYLASSLANAQAAIKIDITSTGTGTHTITPTALAGGTVKLQASASGVASTYVDIPGSEETLTASTIFARNVTNPHYSYLRVYYTLTAGQISGSQRVDRREV